MRAKKHVIEIQEDEQLVQIELEEYFIDFYRKETGHRRVTNDGLCQFINRLKNLFCR